MPTGACGINCDVCRLKVIQICSSCGSGKSLEAEKKKQAQIRILGAPCPILECAIEKRIDYCNRDCPEFPCNIFREIQYPFSTGYLNMVERRLKEQRAAKTPSGDVVSVPEEYWDDLLRRDLNALCNIAEVRLLPPNGILVPFLGKEILIDLKEKSLKRLLNGKWEKIDNPLLELLTLVYLLNVRQNPLKDELIGVKELKDAQFFQGPHELKTKPVLDLYGNDTDGFIRAAERLGGKRLDLADVAYKIPVFPKIPLYYLLWEGDDEFEPRLSVLFDSSIDTHFSADAIWGLVNLVSDWLTESGLDW